MHLRTTYTFTPTRNPSPAFAQSQTSNRTPHKHAHLHIFFNIAEEAHSVSQHNEPDAEQSRPPRPKTSCSFLQIFYGRRLMAPIKKKKKPFYRLACVRPHGDAAQTPKSSRRLRVNGPTDGRPESQTPHIIYVRIRTFPGAARPAAPPTIRLPIPTHINAL